MDKPAISVIVNTYNRAATLENALMGLSGLNYSNFEVVVVNGPSTDQTEEIAERWAHFIKVVRCNVANLAISRNVGIAAAAGDIIAFLDDDAIPHPQWLSRLSIAYADELVGAVGGFTVDNTGVRFQCRKTVCDRYGNAHHVSSMFDERSLNLVGSPLYPSLLGTNSSFRTDILREIGGFDHTFSYFLDETDVCLRIVDAGFKILYESSALVFHQFAASHIRSARRIARTVYPSAVSKAYFIMRHGSAHSYEAAGKQLANYRTEVLNSIERQAVGGDITLDHRISLEQDLLVGIKDGICRASDRAAKKNGDLDASNAQIPFKKFARPRKKRIAFVSQQYSGPFDAGISRWTFLAATGLASRGHTVHVICRGDRSTSFSNGVWVHSIEDEAEFGDVLAAQEAVPQHIASRAAAVRNAMQYVKSFGLDAISFPIWDLEGIGCLDDRSVSVIMSLHTTYGLAQPHKVEWNTKPLFRHFVVDPVIAAERRLLATVPTIIANSAAIVRDLQAVSYTHLRAHET